MNIIKKAAAVFFAVLLLCGSYRAEAEQTGVSAVNAAEISYEQLDLCLAEMLDGFEGDGTVRTAQNGAALYTSGAEELLSPFEGGSMLMLSGTGAVGAELSFLKHPDADDCRSVAVSVYVKPAGTGADYTLSIFATFTNTEVTGTGEITAGSWQTAYLPVSEYKPGQLVSVRITVASSDGGVIEAALDCLHTANVDGMPEDLPLFASDFSCRGGKLSYSGGSLTFEANGKEPYIESSVCNYLIDEKYNALAITLVNSAGASSAVLSCRMNGAAKYNESDVYGLELQDGRNTYYFKAGNYRGQSVLNAFRLTFSEKLKGSVTVEKIELTSYRFPTRYPGTLSVTESGPDLKISGSVPSYPATSKEIRLYRLLPGQDEERFEELDVTPYRTAEPAKTFSFVIPKEDNGIDNTLYKYFAVYYGDSAFYAAPAAYVPSRTSAAVNTGERCVSYQPDLSLLTEAEPDAVFFTLDTDKIYNEDGTVNEEYLSEYDLAAKRLGEENISAAFILTRQSGAPDLSSEAQFDGFVSILRFVCERYAGVIRSVVPCPELDSESLSDSAGSDDRAVRYAAALARTASAVLTPYGVKALLPVSSDCETRFLMMIGEEKLSDVPFGFLLCGRESETLAQRSAASYVSTSLLYKNAKRETIYKTKLPDDLSELLSGFYYATGFCSGVYYDGELKDDGTAEIFRSASSADGVAAADAVLKENGGGSVSLLYPHTSEYKKIYKKVEITEDKPDGSVSILFDGKTDERWTTYDACRDVYQGAVNNESAAELTFDFGLGRRGKAVFDTGPVTDNGAFYIRLYADYLPSDTGSVKVTVYLYGDNGCVYGDVSLRESEIAAVCIKTDELLGAVRRIVFAVSQNEDGTLATPRICAAEIYAADAKSEQTVTDPPETEPPKPETQVFVTETQTEPAQTEPVNEGDDTGRLLIITLCVMLGMFVCCGLLIFILKLISDKKQK